MKKRFGFLSLFAVTAVMLALVGGLAALAAPSAADVTGTVALDQDWYTDTGSVKVTVTDADANNSTDRREDDVTVNTLAAGAFLGNQVLSNKPITGTPIAVTVDTTTEVTNLEVQVVSAELGVVNILAGAAANYGDIDITYKTSTTDTVDVKLVSTQDSTGITLTATETGTDTGVFELTLTLADTSSVADKKLSVLDLNTVTASYVDTTPGSGSSDITVTDTAQVEVGDPTFSAITPADEFSTQATQPVLTGTINDVGGAGLDVSTITLLIDLDSNGTFDGGDEAVTPTVTGDDGDTTATFTLTPSVLSEGNHIWQITVSDMAGNAATSDSDDDSDGDQSHLISVDLSPPAMTVAETGKYWDSDAEAEASNKLDRLVITFGEKVDSDSVSAADFTVEDVAPLSAVVESDAPTKVYLTLASDLAADDEPVVAIATAGAVSDKAGNSLNVGQITADDEIAPTFTVTLDKTLTDDDVVITVSSDEKISGVPSVKAHNIDGSNVKTLSVVVKTSTSWEATSEDASAYEGKNSIVVVGSDLENNSRTKGDATITDAAFASDAIVYTQDTTAPVVTFDPADGGTVLSTSPFVTLTFDDEVTVDAASFGEEGEDLVDVLADGDLASDNKTWIYKASGLTVDGEYTIEVTVTDLAGNETEDADADFTVDEADDEEVALVPGSNLVSVSGAPADSDINAVITLSEVSSVVTYEAATGTWLSATRDADGDLSGTLSTIDSQHAYWVSTTSFEPIEVEILQTGSSALPPSIPVVAGWNMVPVTNVAGASADVDGATAGIQLGADSYFGSTSWVTAYTWDTKNEAWLKTLPSTFGEVTVGKGYWLYVSAAGVLVP